MKKTAGIATILLLGSICAQAQLGGLGKKLSGSKSGPDAGAIVAQGQDLLAYVTVATDNGMQAVEAILTVFPPEKVRKIADLAVKYNELKAKRNDQNIDAESLEIASKIATETAQLDSEWQSHVKEKSAAVKKADARLALVVLADGIAALKAPETAKALQGAVQDLKSDPTQAPKIKRMASMATLLLTVGKEVPQQVTSFKTVRGMTKRIAEAEKVQLATDPQPAQVRDTATMTNSYSAL